MTSIDPSRIPGDVSTSWMKNPVPKNVADPEAYKAARGFESYFTRHLVKEMLGKSDLIGGKGFGGEVYQDMFVQAIGDQMATSGKLGITEMIYRQVMANKGIDPYIKPDEDKKTGDMESLALVIPHEMMRYKDIVQHAADRYKIDPELIFAVMQQESGGDPDAVSHAGAKGLMQLMDTTAADLGVNDSFDPIQNIHGGAKYLREQLDQFGDVDKALAAYNAGPGAVRKHGGIPPYDETRDYVDRVTRIYNRLKGQMTDAVAERYRKAAEGLAVGKDLAAGRGEAEKDS